MARPLSLQPLFALVDRAVDERASATRESTRTATTALERHMRGEPSSAAAEGGALSGLQRIERCRSALDALDRRGWDRSFHQRLFHEEYLKACARLFFKRDGPGAFARHHTRVLEVNGWDATPQEILVSTPRRFGKTISVSMFAAALLFAAPNVELSIYSTCKRISQKLLRNIARFLDLIYLELGVPPYKILRMNSEASSSAPAGGSSSAVRPSVSGQNAWRKNSARASAGSARAAPATSAALPAGSAAAQKSPVASRCILLMPLKAAHICICMHTHASIYRRARAGACSSKGACRRAVLRCRPACPPSAL